MKKKKYILIPTIGTFLILLITGFSSLELSKSRKVIIPIQQTMLETVPLASASHFAVLAGTSINNIGETNIEGEIGISPGTWICGFSKNMLIQNNSHKLLVAKLDLTTAYTNAEERKSKDMVRLNGNIGGLTLTPGLYNSTSSLQISSGNLTFDALGRPNAVFIIQIANTLITRPNSRVILKGGALSSNIFWQIGSTATFGSGTDFKGTIMALNSIKFYDGAFLEGRAFARNGKIEMEGSSIIK